MDPNEAQASRKRLRQTQRTRKKRGKLDHLPYLNVQSDSEESVSEPDSDDGNPVALADGVNQEVEAIIHSATSEEEEAESDPEVFANPDQENEPVGNAAHDESDPSSLSSTESEQEASENEQDIVVANQDQGDEPVGIAANVESNSHSSASSESEQEASENEPGDSDLDELLPASESSSEEGEASESASEISAESDADSEEDEAAERSEESNADSSDDEGIGPIGGNELLYPGAPITVLESLLSILTLATVMHVSGALLGKILELIALHCPPNNFCKKTLYTFKSFFEAIGSSLVVLHYYCSKCVYPLHKKNSRCRSCKRRGDVGYFIELPLLGQLQRLFAKRNFYDDLQHRFHRTKKHEQNIEDVYDGRIYKAEVESGFLSNPNNISFMFYTDGVKIFKSSKFSLWPICLVINELEYKKRILPSNILTVGLWFGHQKPNPNVFLRPLRKTMQEFSTTGYLLKLHDGSEVLVKGKILLCTCDLPAKSLFLAFKNFNGYHGCCLCLCPGERYILPKNSVQVYPYTPHVELRTDEQTKQFAEQAIEARRTNKKASVNGVKGSTVLSHLVPDIIKCMGLDVMHGVFIGHFAKLLDLWFSPKFSNRAWTMHHLCDEVNARLKVVKVPSFIQRFQRTLTDVALLKASELKVLFFFTLLPVLQDIMDENYFVHHCKLVSAIFLLSQDSISPNQIEASRALLNSYVSDFQVLYDVRYMGINVHNLPHYPDVVLELGNLWVYSCFFLESLNGELSKLFHGTQYVALQISTSVMMYMQIPVLIDNLRAGSPVYPYCKNLLKKAKKLKVSDVISEGVYAVGCYKKNPSVALVTHSLEMLSQIPCDVNGRVNIFFRLKKHGVVFTCTEYSRISVRKDSTFVSFVRNQVHMLGRLVRFVRLSRCTPQCQDVCRLCESQYFFVAKVYDRVPWLPAHLAGNIRLSYLSKVRESGQVIALPVSSLRHLCFAVHVQGNTFIASPISEKDFLEN